MIPISLSGLIKNIAESSSSVKRHSTFYGAVKKSNPSLFTGLSSSARIEIILLFHRSPISTQERRCGIIPNSSDGQHSSEDLSDDGRPTIRCSRSNPPCFRRRRPLLRREHNDVFAKTGCHDNRSQTVAEVGIWLSYCIRCDIHT